MYQVEGYSFESKEIAKLAKKEAEGIKLMRAHINPEDAESVLQLYKKLISNDLFQTVIGYTFLKELQSFLRMSPGIKAEDIPLIPVYDKQEDAAHLENYRETLRKNNTQKQDEETNAKLVRYRNGFYVSVFFSVVFVLGIIGMFLIVYFSGNNINIFNYENELINRYEVWEQELDEREKELDQREEEVERRENLLQQQMQ